MNDNKFESQEALKTWLISKGVDAEDEEDESVSQKLLDKRYSRPVVRVDHFLVKSIKSTPPHLHYFICNASKVRNLQYC